MSVLLPAGLPAIDILAKEGIRLDRGGTDGRRLRVALLNLMPLKIEAEADIVRALAASERSVDLCLLKLRSHVSTHVSVEHMSRFYRFFDEVASESIDGLIVNGAPVEELPFEGVDYWDELCRVFDWARERVASSLYICWGAQAALHARYGLEKFKLEWKRFGIYRERALMPGHPIMKGLGQEFWMPHSRHTEIRRNDVLACDDLTLLADGEESGISIIVRNDNREYYVTGHLEYGIDRLDWEYRRDRDVRSDVKMPDHYYRDDNVDGEIMYRWQNSANVFFANWLETCI
ncbi:MAG: homoserine O-succinyltransferase [Prevotella sp.]|nr:homoserine O-succinyltransferase [Prevotella sp.]